VVRLSKIANDLSDQNLGGIGVIVDRVMGSLTIDEFQNVELNSSDSLFLPISATKKIDQTVANIRENEYTPIEIILSNIPTDIWQPQRWHPSAN